MKAPYSQLYLWHYRYHNSLNRHELDLLKTAFKCWQYDKFAPTCFYSIAPRLTVLFSSVVWFLPFDTYASWRPLLKASFPSRATDDLFCNGECTGQINVETLRFGSAGTVEVNYQVAETGWWWNRL